MQIVKWFKLKVFFFRFITWRNSHIGVSGRFKFLNVFDGLGKNAENVVSAKFSPLFDFS